MGSDYLATYSDVCVNIMKPCAAEVFTIINSGGCACIKGYAPSVYGLLVIVITVSIIQYGLTLLMQHLQFSLLLINMIAERSHLLQLCLKVFFHL